MQWFYDLKIKTKLLLSFMVVAIIAGVIGYIGVSNIYALNESDTTLYKTNLVPLAASAELASSFQRERVNLMQLATARSQAERETQREHIAGREKAIDEALSEIDKAVFATDVKEMLKRVAETRKAFNEKKALLNTLADAGRGAEARALFVGEMEKDRAMVQDAIQSLNDLLVRRGKARADANAAQAGTAAATMLAVIGAGILVAIGLGFLVAGIISRPVVQVVRGIDNADLNSRFNSTRKDEVGDLQRSFDSFVQTIKNTLLQVSEAAAALASASSQISSSTEEMAAGAHEQTSQAGEVASAVEEMTKTIVENSKNAGSTAEYARRAKNAAEDGVKISQRSLEAIGRNVEVAGEVGAVVNELGQSSEKIGDIITVIDDIADQTNLLALNAAIEAARAGEQGRGFAVVADEVRKLAERTTKATKEIADLIKSIQGLTTKGVRSMEKAGGIVNENREMTNKTAEALKGIVEVSAQVTDMVGQIAAASEEQSSASEQISKNVEAISTVTQQTASGTQQIARAAEDLNRLTENLQQILQQFRIDSSAEASRHSAVARASGSHLPQRQVGRSASDERNRPQHLDFGAAKNAHRLWRVKVQKLLLGAAHMNASEVVTHKDCQLGRWYYGEGSTALSSHPAYAELGIKHRDMHDAVRKVVELWNAGDQARAEELAHHVYELSDAVVQLLTDLEHSSVAVA